MGPITLNSAGSAMHVLGTKPFRMKTLIRVPTAMGLCPGMGMKLCVWKENHSKGGSVHHILCFSEARSKTWQTFVLEDHHLPPNCRSERTALHCQGQKTEMWFHWAVKRDGQSTGRKHVPLPSRCDFTVSVPWKNIRVSWHSLMLTWHQFWLHCGTLTQNHVSVSLRCL